MEIVVASGDWRSTSSRAMYHSRDEHFSPTRLSEVAPQGNKTSLFSGTWQGNTGLTWFSEMGEHSAEELSISAIFKCKVLSTPADVIVNLNARTWNRFHRVWQLAERNSVKHPFPPTPPPLRWLLCEFSRIGVGIHCSVKINVETLMLVQ
jgi:hypothetical protein